MKAIVLASSPRGVGVPLHEANWPFFGQPLIDVQLEAIGRLGAREVWVSMRHRPYALDRYLQARTAVPLATVRLERDDQGSVGTLRRAERFVTETTLVLPADMLPPGDLSELLGRHRESGAWLTRVRDPRGNALYWVEPALLGVLGESGDLSEAFEALASWGHPVQGLGHAELARLDTLEGALRAHASRLEGRTVHPTAWVHPAAKLGERVWIGPGCRVGREAQLEDAVLLSGAQVQRGARLSGVLVLPGVRVGRASRFEGALLTAEGAYTASGFRPEGDPEVLSARMRSEWGEALHQGLDMLLAFMALLILAPVMLGVALAIRMDSPGPVFYSQLRVGQDRRGRLRGRVFELYKFRTMHLDADARLEELKAQNAYGSGPFFKLDHDPRITRVGDVLRRTSLDELPQLFNVLLGDMRLVGNRPLPVYEAEALGEDWQRMRFACPAGITGLWQISGRSDLSEHERMVLDTVYAVTRSFWSDWGILLRTIPALLMRRGAR